MPQFLCLLAGDVRIYHVLEGVRLAQTGDDLVGRRDKQLRRELDLVEFALERGDQGSGLDRLGPGEVDVIGVLPVVQLGQDRGIIPPGKVQRELAVWLVGQQDVGKRLVDPRVNAIVVADSGDSLVPAVKQRVRDEAVASNQIILDPFHVDGILMAIEHPVEGPIHDPSLQSDSGTLVFSSTNIGDDRDPRT